MPDSPENMIKLTRGSHQSPRHGLCVMELASLLAGERFSDHPASVCPVIGSVMRSYNDAVSDPRRQDLYPYAARMLGTRSTTEISELRRARIIAWAREGRPVRRLPRWRARDAFPEPCRKTAGAIAMSAIRAHTDRTHARVLALLDELIEIGMPPDPEAAPMSATTGAGHAERTAV
jgi:hypothetical protein